LHINGASRVNIDKMSLAELKAMAAKVEAAIPTARAREAQAVRDEVNSLLAKKGLKLSDVMGQAGSARRSTKGRSVPVKFRDPKSGAEWSGRGRHPKWYDPKHSDKFQVRETA
jgi:DNA-binding protein H-NS